MKRILKYLRLFLSPFYPHLQKVIRHYNSYSYAPSKRTKKSSCTLFKCRQLWERDIFLQTSFFISRKKKIFSQKYNSKKVFRLHENSFPKYNHIFVKRQIESKIGRNVSGLRHYRIVINLGAKELIALDNSFKRG